MLSQEKENYILSTAYVPEHIPKLMSFLSGGESILIDEKYLNIKGPNWLIFIGYPLNHNFDIKDLEITLQKVLEKFRPETLWLLTQELPHSLSKKFKKLEEDYYYKLDIINSSINEKLLKIVRKTHDKLKVVVEKIPTTQHTELINEFLHAKSLSKNIEKLYIKLPEYVKNSGTSFFLSSYTREGKLTAFYIVEMAAKLFSAYLVGCYSKKNYVPHSSDILMFDLIKISKNEGKRYINLGIGVNEGIRRFKEKWGGVSFLKYETYKYERLPKFFEYFLVRF